MNSKPSNSNSQSKAFDSFHERIQRWIWQKKWEALYDVQEKSSPLILSKEHDVLISATTAGGKTEAVFFPILSNLLIDNEKVSSKSFQVLYISPLKALINDQFQRLEDLCNSIGDIYVCPWHGDASKAKKAKGLKNPEGILLITPESLEALFVNRGYEINRLFNDLQYIVVDELHSFMGLERGKQLQSLMSRIDHSIKKEVPRVGMSATIGDMFLAAKFLRPRNPESVKIVMSTSDSRDLKVQIRGSINECAGNDEDDDRGDAKIEIAKHIFEHLRGEGNLIFANSRKDVEQYSDLLRQLSDERGVPNEFLPHHGNLSKSIREDAESSLKDPYKPSSVVCTSTLELGIDIGSVKSVAQIGAPHNVSSLRQRLGRSGRRDGDPSILRMYIEENSISKDTSVSDKLRLNLVQGIAVVNLLVNRWCEPSEDSAPHFSTLIQQTLSMIAERGGLTAESLYSYLCKNGAFSCVTQQQYIEMLRCLANDENDLIQQSNDSTLLLSPKGEKIVNWYDFYAAFQSTEDYKVVNEGKTLGTIPGNKTPVREDALIVFAGMRWRVVKIYQNEKIIEVVKSEGGIPLKFYSIGGRIHDAVVKEMFKIYSSSDSIIFLDKKAQEMLQEGRKYFNDYGLHKNWLVKEGDSISFFTWSGSKITNAICLLLMSEGAKLDPSGEIVIQLKSKLEDLNKMLETVFRKATNLHSKQLALKAKNKIVEKYDQYLTEELLACDYEKKCLDLNSALKLIESLLKGCSPKEFFSNTKRKGSRLLL